MRRILDEGNRYQLLWLDECNRPLALGRTRRFATTAQRRVLAHRQGGLCAWPGCANPATVAHHQLDWHHGGPTDLDNLAGLCHTHDARTQTGWTLTTEANGTTRATHPHGHTIAAPPRWPPPPPDQHPPPEPEHRPPPAHAPTGPITTGTGEALTTYALDVYLHTLHHTDAHATRDERDDDDG